MTQQEQYYWQQMQRQNTLKAYCAQFGQNGHFGFGLSADNNVVAASMPKFTIKLTTLDGGQVVPDEQTVVGGAEVEIVAIPDEGHVFLKWSDGNTNSSRSVVVNRNIELTAVFKEEEKEEEEVKETKAVKTKWQKEEK